MQKIRFIAGISLVIATLFTFASCEEESKDNSEMLAAVALMSSQNSSGVPMAFYWVFKSDGNAVRCVELDTNYAEKQAEYTERMNTFVSRVNSSVYTKEFSMETGSGGCPSIGSVVAKCASYGYDGIEGNRIYKTNEAGLTEMPAVYDAIGSGHPWSTNVKTECEEGSPIQGATGTFECLNSNLCGSY